jgi:hypothetical protein
MKLNIYECDSCRRPFYVSVSISPLPKMCCYCGSTDEIVNTAEVDVEEINGDWKLELSLTPLGGDRPILS